jgi:hypothetical protein
MKNQGKQLVCILSILALGHELRATVMNSPANRYGVIVQRNVFNLVPEPAQKLEPPPRPTARITLTGITSILGDMRALLNVQPPAAAASVPAKEVLLILTEGQEEAQIRVLEINEIAATVKVDNCGTIMVLTFERDGPKPANLPAPVISPRPRVKSEP